MTRRGKPGTRSEKPLPVRVSGRWLDCQETRALAAMFEAGGRTARFVGGVVRNSLLGEPVNDLDIATEARPEEVMAMAEAAGFRAIGTGLAHGTVTVVVHGHIYEVTTLRIDVETHGRHATVAFTDDWREDAARRDFTMNALYANFDGSLYDPLGGYPDLLAGRVRFIGAAEDRIREDYLRILRFFRFTAKYGHGGIDAVGLAACLRLRAGINGLSAERIRSEFVRLLATRGAFEVLDIMLGHGLLLPIVGGVAHLGRLARWLEVERLLGLEREPIDRIGALCVDTSEDAERLLRRLRLSNEEAARLRLWSQRSELSPQMDEKAARIACYRLGERFSPLVAISCLRAGDVSNAEGWRQLHTLPERWQPPAFPLKGQDLIKRGMKPGPDIGKRLADLEARWLASDFALTREELLALV
jgi:poly(A) polymerase